MDESGVHDGSPVVTVGAYFAKPSIWQRWTKDWNRQKRPINVFHANHCANLRGEFSGWEETHRDEFVAKLLPIIAEHRMAGLSVGVHLHEFEKAIATEPLIREMFGTPYTACFQWAVQIVLTVMMRLEIDERVAVFHEQNEYQGEAIKAFDWVRQNRKIHRRDISLTFGTKQDYIPLQAADILAYEANKRLRDPDKRPLRRAWIALDPDESRIKLVHYGKKNMTQLIHGLSEMRDELLASGWDGKVVP